MNEGNKTIDNLRERVQKLEAELITLVVLIVLFSIFHPSYFAYWMED